ncbi:MAG: penicillin-insensitive murein endopeptidase [Rhodobacteraceae bacterium CG17_big_fil_post_rev_8_21_14_2_50_65_11]|nr:MAG: penicillin-insensitive murein endopeptidase [Rhodobacteraceae bacterium CG17_big_fil_post_rev_8_21_14_2_50_65_11]
MLRAACLCLLALLLAACATAEAPLTEAERQLVTASHMDETPARRLFGQVRAAQPARPAVLGGYARGCVQGAERLPETGPTWQAMRLSRNRNWGHPELLDYLRDLSRAAATLPGWEGLYIGDLAQPAGGPMLTGHASHQSGLDADIWMLPATDLALTRQRRESLSSISTRRAGGAFVGENWTEQHWHLLRAAASDPRVARIFVFPGAKVWMCDRETGDRSYLRNIRPLHGHHTHFHVRLHCPDGNSDCVEQDPPPPGDGCEEARVWQRNIISPPPPQPGPAPPAPARPAPARGEIMLSDLPQQCTRVLLRAQ